MIMYSPKIKEDLIPILYKLAKQEGKSMTHLVDDILRNKFRKREWQICQEENKEESAMNLKKRTNRGGIEDFLEG